MIYNGAGKMYGVGEGLERGAGHVLNAVMMKKRLELAKQAADTERLKTEADVRRSDAYTNHLNSRDLMRQFMDAHAEVPAWLERKRAQKAGGGTGSTANQLATRYAAAPGAGTALPVVAPRGDEMFELNAKRAPIQAPLIQPEDPRVLLQPGGQPLYADGE